MDGTVLKSYEIDYVSQAAKANGDLFLLGLGSQSGTQEEVQFDPTTSRWWVDLVAHFDIDPPACSPNCPSDTQALEIQGVGTNLFNPTFTNQESPSGKATEWFRFRVDGSSSTWQRDTRGRWLARLQWDTGDPTQVTGYFDMAERPFLRVLRYADIGVTSAGPVTVGLDVMRPDEAPGGPEVTRTINLTSSGGGNPAPVACGMTEATDTDSTWIGTDQFLHAGCSVGTTLQYSWNPGTGYLPFSSDPSFEFLGHSQAGSQTVGLIVEDAAFSPPTADTIQLGFSVVGSSMTLAGPQWVFDKRGKTYTSNHNADWYERYDPDTLTAWYFTLNNSTTYNRIWPAGDYTRRLRAERARSNPNLPEVPLGRAWMDVHVCSIPGCVAQVIAGPDMPASVDDRWPIFGAGPWVITDARLTRLYDLTGLHAAGSPFADVSWMELEIGEWKDPSGLAVSWERIVDTNDVRAYDFHFEDPPRAAFGVAIDADLGRNAADDRSALDAAGLVLVWDGESAIGFMLLDGANSAVGAVRQYGARETAPRPQDVSKVEYAQGAARLMTEPDDVQLVLRAKSDIGSVFRFVAIRGETIEDVRQRAEAFLSSLRSD